MGEGAALKTFFTSDLHFGHANVIDYCKRPYDSVARMNEAIVVRFNWLVSPKDLCWFLGDLTLGHHADLIPWITRMNGRKILVKGNHDKFTDAQYYAMGFENVLHEAVIQVGKRRLRLSHYPRRPRWYESLFKPKHHYRYLERRPPDDGMWLLHGHQHSKVAMCARRKAYDVGVDANLYWPVDLQRIISAINKVEA